MGLITHRAFTVLTSHTIGDITSCIHTRFTVICKLAIRALGTNTRVAFAARWAILSLTSGASLDWCIIIEVKFMFYTAILANGFACSWTWHAIKTSVRPNCNCSSCWTLCWSCTCPIEETIVLTGSSFGSTKPLRSCRAVETHH